MTDYSELKRLAEAAKDVAGPIFDVDGPSELCQLAEYVAANPTAVLALIAELERNKRMLLAACMDMGAIGSALDADMNADGDEILGLAVALKAENEALRRQMDECNSYLQCVVDSSMSRNNAEALAQELIDANAKVLG